MRLFTLCSYLKTKESYDKWITMRKWGFRHQISVAKNLKKSVANIWKHSGEFRKRARWMRNFATWRTPFRSQRLISQPPKLAFNLVWSASNGSNFFILTLNRAPFEVLDFWLPELWNDISMHKLSSMKCSKSGWQWLSFWRLHGGFLSLLSLLAF